MGECTPPYSSTGVVNTLMSGLIDWLAFTVPDLPTVFNILSIKESDFIELPKGMNGYKKQKQCGHIRVMYDGSENMGCHVEMSGQACREYETRGGKYFKWWPTLSEVLEAHGSFSRIDLAIDDRSGLLSLDEIERKIKAGEVRSKFRTARPGTEHNLADGTKIGQTIYFGSKSSSIQMRFYDKALEQGVDGTWIRTEIQARDERATAVVVALLGDVPVGHIASGVFRNYVVFVEKNKTDTNKARWAVCEWWNSYLGSVEAIRLSIEQKPRTLKEVESWVNKQIGPTLAMLMLANEGDTSWINEVMVNSKYRLKPKHYAMIASR